VVIKISVLSSGDVLLNGIPASLTVLEEALEKADRTQDSVLYYREALAAEPPPQAMEVIKLVVRKKLPFSFSSVPDFSDYVDRFGQSHPRPSRTAPVKADPFAPGMPDVDLRQKPEDVFAKARQSASSETGVGGVAIVRARPCRVGASENVILSEARQSRCRSGPGPRRPVLQRGGHCQHGIHNAA
jgi:hypothetical protein